MAVKTIEQNGSRKSKLMTSHGLTSCDIQSEAFAGCHLEAELK